VVSTPESDRVGLMVIRVMYVEGRFRARIVSSSGLDERDETVSHLADRDAVIEAVSAWLDEFVTECDADASR
jgi:hypothetical protein